MRWLANSKSDKLDSNDVGQIAWLLGNFLSVLTLSAFVSLDVQNIIIPVFAFLVTCMVTLFPRTPARIPNWFWKLTNVFLVLFLLVDFLSSEFVAALIDLNVLLILLRSLSYRKKREDMQLILLCLFLIVISGVMSQAMAFALHIALFSCISMALLFVINLRDNGIEIATTRDTFEHFNWLQLFARVIKKLDLRHLVFGGVLFSILVSVSAMIFISFPRFNIGQPVPFLRMNSGKSYSGFSEYVGFGDVTDIQDDDSVALRVDVPRLPDFPSAPYWRMLVLDNYSKGTFSTSVDLKRKEEERSRVTRLAYRSSRYISRLHPGIKNQQWTFYLEGGISRYLPVTGVFNQIQFQEQQDLTSNPLSDVFKLDSVSPGVTFYKVTGMTYGDRIPDARYPKSPETITRTLLNHKELFEPTEYPRTTMELHLSDDDEAFLVNLSQQIRSRLPHASSVEYARAVSQYLGSKHKYSKSNRLPGGDRDPVIKWLDSDEPGHCEYFSTSLVLLCRAQGIPARLVTGFHGGTWNSFESYFMVRNRNAHAWVEVFDGDRFWVRVDPTPGGLRSTESLDDATAREWAFNDSSWKAYMDSLRMIWYRKVVNFEDEDQIALLDGIRDFVQGNLEKIPLLLNHVKEEARQFINKPWEVSGYKGFAISFSVMMVTYLILRFLWKRLRLRAYFNFLGRNGNRNYAMLEDRLKAGKLLKRLNREIDWEQEELAAIKPDYEQAHRHLLQIRFGAVQTWPDAKQTFRLARMVARKI